MRRRTSPHKKKKRIRITRGDLEPSDYLQEVGIRFMVGAVARAISWEPYKFDWMAVLSGGQNIGKSTFVRMLFEGFAKEEMPANLADKEAQQAIQGYWCIEMSELSSLKKSSMEATKSFISRVVDSFRPPYAEDVEEFPRKCVFIGTTNDEEFLTDPTGNRRFMPIFCEEMIALEWLKGMRPQLWAESYAIYQEKPDFDTRAPLHLVEEFHKRAQLSDIWENDIRRLLTWDDDKKTYTHEELKQFITPSICHGTNYITRDIIAKGLALPTNIGQVEKSRIANALRKLGYKDERPYLNGKGCRAWIYKED